MSPSSNGITADVIREGMPPYYLSGDLLEATLAALPRPPADASAAWRDARITRLTLEILALRPADAGQARMAADILIVRELADNVMRLAHAPNVTVVELCRRVRTSGELTRTVASLMRTREPSLQKSVPFQEAVVADEVDVALVNPA